MQTVYGSRWVDQTGKGDALKLSMITWAERLAGLTDEEIVIGLENLPEDFAPTPIKFRNLCKQVSKGLTHKSAAYRPFDKSIALEHKADKEKAKHALSEIRQMVGV